MPFTALLTVLLLLLPLAGPAAAEPDVGEPVDPPAVRAQNHETPHVEHTYEVSTRGRVGTDPSTFARTSTDVLNDARAWTLAGSIRFRQVASGGDFELILASPQEVENAHSVCSREYSCRVGNRVYINDDNWRNATDSWNRTGAPLWLYRHYLLNHEVGHWLDFGHENACRSGTDRAPVMMQQSIVIDDRPCDPNGWPLDHERRGLADRYGVPIYSWIFPDVLAWMPHRNAIHEVHPEIVSGHEDGYYRPHRGVTRAQTATFIARAAELDTENRGEPPFDDVDADHVHADSITAVAEEGIVEGYEDGTFRPGRPISRAQMATFIAGAYGLEAQDDPRFDDVDPDDEHADAIAAIDENGIATGYGDGTYRPGEQVSRAQMASFIARAERQE